MTPESRNELLELADRYIDSRLNEEEVASLDTWLRKHEGARQVFSDYLHDHAALYWSHVSSADSGIFRPQEVQKRNHWKILTLVSCLAIGLSIFLYRTQRHPAGSASVQGTVARIIRAEGDLQVNQAEFIQKGEELQVGDALSMDQGLLEMVFQKTGVHVIATAPLSISELDHSYMKLRSGEVKLHVPPQGIGFVVETKERRITDLGTRFVVTAHPKGSKVFVLDGQIAVAKGEDLDQRLMNKGEVANFYPDGSTNIKKQGPGDLPEMSLPSLKTALPGTIYTLANEPGLPKHNRLLEDRIGEAFLPLIESGFSNKNSLNGLNTGNSTFFSGIAGSHRSIPERLIPGKYPRQFGWMIWYSGKVTPPRPGRYRFWGYADNHLLVSIDRKTVLEGSRFDTSFREQIKGVSRRNHPAFPCLNSSAGIASGEWFEVSNDPVELNILFGEMNNPHTSGLLLIEREGDAYQETIWGQPKWPVFLTSPPANHHRSDLNHLQSYLEEKLMGSFSVSNEAIWSLVP